MKKGQPVGRSSAKINRMMELKNFKTEFNGVVQRRFDGSRVSSAMETAQDLDFITYNDSPD